MLPKARHPETGRKASLPGRATPALAIHDPSSLFSEVTVEDAVVAFETHLLKATTNVAAAIDEFESPPHGLEFALSVVNDDVYHLLASAIVRSFPPNPTALVNAGRPTLAVRLLQRFSMSLLFLPYPSFEDQPPELAIYHREVQWAPGVLRALPNLSLPEWPTSPIAEEDDENNDNAEVDDFPEVRFVIKRKGQHKRQQSKRSNRTQSLPVDLSVFKKYGMEAPCYKDEVAPMSASIFQRQLEILKSYLKLFRNPTLAPLLKKVYIPERLTDAPVSSAQTSRVDEVASEGPADETPAAYPLVQPMKAALYFESAVGFGEWRILISSRADGDLRQARKRDKKLFAIFVKKIKELSNGHFSEDNHKKLTGLDVEVPIYEAKMTGDTRLVYQVDCIPEYQTDVERQVLRIFGIYTHAQLDHRFWDCMGRQLGRKGSEYKKRCTFRNRPKTKGDNVIMPAMWPQPEEPAALEPTLSVQGARKEDLEEMHALLVLEKFVTFSQELLNSILADQDVAHVFDVSPQEKKIIEHTSSCYVLGRSGTGKTTTMLFKMLGIERAWEGRRENTPKPRQLFVTQSRVLAEKVEEYFAKLLESLATANKSASELVKLAAKKKDQQEQGLVDRDEETYWRGDLPKRYGELKAEHFPMFVTYDHLCRLLEAEFHHINADTQKQVAVSRAMQEILQPRGPREDQEGLSNDYMQQRREAFVSYGTFLEAYWSHFSQSLTKGLDPSLVFGEFMGVIKGSEQALKEAEGYLDRGTYLNLSHRTQATFANQRDSIYKLFQAYLKKKKERGDYDAADRTHAIITFLRSLGVPGDSIDFIYIDEAQDNLLIDALVLRTICRNPNGMFWAGDTAQTISVGSAFRFNDLKAFLHRVEEEIAGPSEERIQPASFQLVVNYRSHAGIVEAAQSVIQLITEFWPNAIDSLAEEKGKIDGPKPVFFSGWDQHTVRYEQFLFGESGSQIEFGAQQCILVRDDAARDRLRAQVGDIGLIMTLYESKGLEFNDVLLYNFFEDSTVDIAQWRVILNLLPPEARAKHPPPRFEEARHSGVCRELKFLYVAITRARKNLWIADCSEKGEPMRILWTGKDQIQNYSPGMDVPKLAMSSTPEDWAKTAQSLFNNRRYMQAMHCYERAGLPREQAASHAYYLREQARAALVGSRGDTQPQTRAYVTAAEAFLASAREAVREKRTYYRIAAECFVNSGDDVRAAGAYRSASEFTLAARYFRKAGKFDDAVDVIKSHRKDMDPTVADGIVEVSRLHYLRENKIKEARELFDTDEDALEYMDDYGLDVARAVLFEQLGRFADAAELHLAEGNSLEAIRVLSLDRDNESSVRKAYSSLLDGLWRHMSCGTAVTREYRASNSTLAKLIELIKGLEGAKVDENSREEVSMFRAIYLNNWQELPARAERLHKTHHIVPAAFLCLDYYFSTSPNLNTLPLPAIAPSLRVFLAYVQILQTFTAIREPSKNAGLSKLYAFEAVTEEMFRLSKDTVLAKACIGNKLTPGAKEDDRGVTVPRWELNALLHVVLKNNLLRRVRPENAQCRMLRVLQPCLPFAVYRQCNRNECPRNHVDGQRYDAAAYNARVRVHMQQILIYQTVHACEDAYQFGIDQKFWLRQLYEALFPSYYKLGSIQLLDPTLIPEFQRGLQVVQTWVRDALYRLDPYKPPMTFLTDLLRACTLAVFFSSKAAAEYLHRIPCVQARPTAFLRGKDQVYVVHNMLSYIQSTDQEALHHGILFLNHILEVKVPVDIGVLCNFMDHVCLSYVTVEHLRGRQPLHDLTLPKSWVMRIVAGIDKLSTMALRLPPIFKQHMGDLLEAVYTGNNAGHLSFEGREVFKLSFPLKNILVLRICRTLCLLGYNCRYRNWEVRNDIVRAMSTLRQPGRSFNPIIEGYINARHWDQLARIVRSSTIDSPIDEMIQLFHGSEPIPRSALPNVRRVIYRRVEDIPFLLKTGGATIGGGALRGDAAAFTPSGMQTPERNDVIEPEDTAEDAPETGADGPEDATEQAVDVDGITEAIDATLTDTASGPSDEEIAAATVLVVAYRRLLTRRQSRKKKTLDHVRDRINDSFNAQTAKMEWPYAYYRLLYRGPIVHLFVVIERMKDYLFEARNATKKRLRLVQHLELETTQSALGLLNQRFKDSHRLWKELAPESDLHVRRDLEALKARVLEVEEMVHALPSAVNLEWQEDLKLAIKGIVKEKPVPVKEEKPELNVSLDDEYEEY